MYGFLLDNFSNFVPKTHRFWDTRLLSIQSPWNPGWGSLKVIENYTIQYGTPWLPMNVRSIVTVGLSRTVSEINGDIRRKSHENRQIFPFPVYLTPPLKGFPVEFVSSQMSQETRVMGLSDGRKSFQIDLAVLIQYRSVTDTHPATQPDTLP